MLCRSEWMYLRAMSHCRSLNSAMYFTSGKLIMFGTFGAIAFLGGKVNPSVVFTTLALYEILRASVSLLMPWGIQHLVEALGAISRLQVSKNTFFDTYQMKGSMQQGHIFIWLKITKHILISNIYKLKMYKYFFQYLRYAPNSWTFSYFDDLMVLMYRFISKWIMPFLHGALQIQDSPVHVHGVKYCEEGGGRGINIFVLSRRGEWFVFIHV